MKKQMTKFAIIGGSGLYNIEGAKVLSKQTMDTPYGKPSGDIVEIDFDGATCFFLPRHGEQHSLLPQEVNYCANIYALKQLGVTAVISISAVGSLVDNLPPGSFFLPDQFINMAKGIRKNTFFGNGIVGHVSVAKPINKDLINVISEQLSELNIKSNGSYVCIEGPQLSSKAESELYKSMGASVIGMTNATEAYLCREAGMAFASICMVTDYDSWKGEDTGIEEIIRVMTANVAIIKKNISKLVHSLHSAKLEYETGNSFSVLTPREAMSGENACVVDTLLN